VALAERRNGRGDLGANGGGAGVTVEADGGHG
jgi:hypothetical protein